MSQAQSISFLEIDLESSLAAQLLAYPRGGPEEMSERILEARSIGIESISAGGPTIIGGIPILGKGCVGLAVKARHSSIGPCAIKIRRTDADRLHMAREAGLHYLANNSRVGPRIHAHSKNFLVMDLVKGETISSWSARPITKQHARSVVISVLDQCFRLDCAGLDHGELSRIGSHVLVSDDSATIVDFESASTSRKVANVTSAAQALLLYGRIAKRIAAILGEPQTDAALHALRRYKASPSRECLDSLLGILIPS